MNTKPQIDWNNRTKKFERNGVCIDYDTALEIFNAGSGDWSHQAYWTMSQIVMGRAQQPV